MITQINGLSHMAEIQHMADINKKVLYLITSKLYIDIIKEVYTVDPVNNPKSKNYSSWNLSILSE